ncbi:hypothetical protein D3C76_1885690 [compost metagenome]
MEKISELMVPNTAVIGAQSTPKAMIVATIRPQVLRVSSSLKYGTMNAAISKMPPM